MIRTALVALVFSIGVGMGYTIGGNKLDKALLAAQKDHDAKALEYAKTSAIYYDKYQEALATEPVVITERVYVRATCPTPDNGGGLGEGRGAEARAELHSGTVNRAAKVTTKAENEVKACRAALKSLLRKIEQ